MPSRVVSREASSAEMAYLEKLLGDAPTTGRRWMQGAENALVFTAASMLALVVVWLGLAWLGRKLFALEFGLHSGAILWIVGVGGPACLICAIVSSTRWIKGWPDYRPLLRADIDNRKIEEEHYIFTEARRFQEPEHGGLIYFLRTPDDKVFTFFDGESQDLGVQDADPLESSFFPQQSLVIARAPVSRFVISREFSGPALEVGAPMELIAEPDDWPETEEYCGIPWADLQSRLGSGQSVALQSSNENPA